MDLQCIRDAQCDPTGEPFPDHDPYEELVMQEALIHAEKSVRGVSALIARFQRRARSVMLGTNRITFMMGKYVVKLPRNLNGVADNDWEGSVRHSPHPEMPKYARTRLIYVGEIPVLFMEHVERWSYPQLEAKLGKVPAWVDGIDCQQVGYNRHGQLVAYDYGIR